MAAPPSIRLSVPGTPEAWNVPVLFEDAHLLALDKPSGLLVSPDRWDANRPNLMRLLHDGLAAGAAWAAARGTSYLANVHRLDFETSGVILLAKNKPALVELANQFGAGQTAKKYLALAHGRAEEDEFTVDLKLAPHPHRPGLMIVSLAGKHAETRFRVLETFRRYVLLECRPVTGRTHQIRVHLKSRQLTIAADPAYGGKPVWLSALKRDYKPSRTKEERPLLGRLGLHAEELTVRHPATGEPVTIQSPWPKDMTVALKYLRKFGGGAPVAEIPE